MESKTRKDVPRETPKDEASSPELPPDAATRVRRSIPIDQIQPDPGNRSINETEESFSSLVDSIRVFGILQPIQVHERGDTYLLVDGERRWRAARKAGLAHVPSDIWPAQANPRDTLVAGVILNEHHEAHRCIHVARRLREIKNSEGLTSEQLAARLGMPVDRVKTYLCLFNGSEFLLEFFAKHDVPIRVAAEFIRYEKATNEAKSRKLALQFIEEPVGHEEIVRLRKRDSAPDDATDETSPPAREHRPTFFAHFDRIWKKNPQNAMSQLGAMLAEIGFRVVPLDPVSPSEVEAPTKC